MLPGHMQVIGELLTGHPEAVSLQAEASHCRALARCSAADASQAFDAVQAARLGYEELRHRLDPRRVRTIGLAVGLITLILVGVGLTLLDAIELSVVLGPARSVLPALAAAAVWLAGSWVAALATRERRWGVCPAAGTGGALLGLLLAALRGFGHQNILFGTLVSVLILGLASAAAVLIARMESSSLFAARWRWHQARASHRAASRIEQGDLEAATVATESWLGLVRTRASVLAGDERLVQETVALAMELLESGHCMPPSTGGCRASDPRCRRSMTVVDITQLILDDHHEQRRLFSILEQIDRSDTESLSAVWGRLAAFLEVHAAAEEAIFYPELLKVGIAARRKAGVEGETLDAIHDHNEIRDAVGEVARHSVGSDDWYAAVAGANLANGDHMAEEEREGLTDFRRLAGLQRRHDLAVAFAAFEARNVTGVEPVDKDPAAYVSEAEAGTLPVGDGSLRIGGLRAP